jgi:hypothetical protein
VRAQQGPAEDRSRSSQRRARDRIVSDEPFPFRLDVFGVDVANLVQSVGGWLYDQVKAGWRIDAYIADLDDPRPLQILGVTALSLTSGTSSLDATAVAVDADFLSSDAHMHQEISSILDHGRATVVVYGASRPDVLDQQFGEMTHRLSSAASVFKTHAALAAAIPAPSTTALECFRQATGRIRQRGT